MLDTSEPKVKDMPSVARQVFKGTQSVKVINVVITHRRCSAGMATAMIAG
jgi:hypothetical protein